MVVLLGCTTMLLHWERVLYIYGALRRNGCLGLDCDCSGGPTLYFVGE